MLRLVITNAVALVASGVVIGLTAAALLARLIATMLYGVVPLDPLTFGAVTAIIALTTAVSIAGPAWRASRIDPAEAGELSILITERCKHDPPKESSTEAIVLKQDLLNALKLSNIFSDKFNQVNLNIL
jgi:hypothetical protein